MDSIEQLYQERIKPLPAKSRLRLMALIAGDLADGGAVSASGERSLLELEGLGAELWRGIDADAYVDTLRGEWSERP